MKPSANEAPNGQKCRWIKAFEFVDEPCVNNGMEGLRALVRENLTRKIGRQSLAYIVHNA